MWLFVVTDVKTCSRSSLRNGEQGLHDDGHFQVVLSLRGKVLCKSPRASLRLHFSNSPNFLTDEVQAAEASVHKNKTRERTGITKALRFCQIGNFGTANPK